MKERLPDIILPFDTRRIKKMVRLDEDNPFLQKVKDKVGTNKVFFVVYEISYFVEDPNSKKEIKRECK